MNNLTSPSSTVERDARAVSGEQVPRREPTCVDREHAPVPVHLAGYDRARTSTYDWSWS